MFGYCIIIMQCFGIVFVDVLYVWIINFIDSGCYKGLEKDGDVVILDMLYFFSVIYDYILFIKFFNLILNQIIFDVVEGV